MREQALRLTMSFWSLAVTAARFPSLTALRNFPSTTATKAATSGDDIVRVGAAGMADRRSGGRHGSGVVEEVYV